MGRKSVFFVTFGCKLNQTEAGILKERASMSGLVVVSDPKIANIIVVNSCSVTHKSQLKVDKLIESLERRFPEKKLMITGCYYSGKKDDRYIPETIYSRIRIIILLKFRANHSLAGLGNSLRFKMGAIIFVVIV